MRVVPVAALPTLVVFVAMLGALPSTVLSPELSAGPPAVDALHAAGHKVFDLRDLPQLPSKIPYKRHIRNEFDEPEPDDAVARGVPGPIDTGSQAPTAIEAAAPNPLTTFDGMHFNELCGANPCGDGHPPDTNGDVGPTYYIETINTAMAIYNKSTGARVVGITFNDLMSQGNFGNLCDTDNFGDPVVLYDTFHDRWIVTDFAFQVDGSGNIVNPPGAYECFAVSKSGDPVSGGWNFYSLHQTAGLGDYPKFGVWPDGLYMSANVFAFPAGGSFQHVTVWSFNLAQMEAGAASPQVVSFNVSNIGGGQPCPPFTLLPSNARQQTGTPPAGRPNLFTSVWCFLNTVDVWKFHVDWNNTANSTFTGPSQALVPSTWAVPPASVPSSGGNSIDTLQIRLMMQNQYTNIGGVESLWDTHTVQGTTASQSAVRWYQTTVTDGSVAANTTQASTFNPTTTLNRFMPSLAVDKLGDMLLGYSTSSSATKPAIKYAGRLAADTASTLPQTENTLIQGASTQTGNCGGAACTRWGDYSAMSLDPDGCTFWYVNEYYAADGLDHHTRIGSIKFTGCTPTPPPTPSPTTGPTKSPSPTP